MSVYSVSRQLLGRFQRFHRVSWLAELGVGEGHVDEQSRLTLGRQAGHVERGGSTYRQSSVAQFHSHGYFMESDVGRSELGVVVAAFRAQAESLFPGLSQPLVGQFRVVAPGGHNGSSQHQRSP